MSEVWRKTLARELAKAGFDRYRDYLASPLWEAAKQRYRAAGLPRECIACGERRYELHHRSYARLGHERPNDLIPLCRSCHQKVHDYLREHGTHLAHTHKALRKIMGVGKGAIRKRLNRFGLGNWKEHADSLPH